METTPTFSDPTALPEPQAGAAPDGHKLREDALRSWFDKGPISEAKVVSQFAFRDGYDACMAVMADSVIRLTEMRVEAETAIAALATSRAETEEARAKLRQITPLKNIDIRLVIGLSQKVATLTATLAQREAEAVELREENQLLKSAFIDATKQIK